MDVGARIAQLRTAYGISQYALWKRSGIAQGALSQYESGAKTPGVDTIEKICAALGIRMTDFFSEESAHSCAIQPTPDEMTLLGYYRMLTPAQQKDALLVFHALSKDAQPTEDSK